MLERQGLHLPWATTDVWRNRELSPTPELMMKKLVRRADLGEDIFCHSWVVSTERSEAVVQSRRTQG